MNATTVTTGIVAQPNSLIKVNGRAKRYNVTHCFKWILSAWIISESGCKRVWVAYMISGWVC